MGETIGIVGSRTYPDFDAIHRYVSALPTTSIVLSGKAWGVGAVAEQVAKECGLNTRTYQPNPETVTRLQKEHPSWSTHQCFALAVREMNQQIARDCSRLVAFWDGKSPGTASTIRYAYEEGKVVQVISSGEK